MPDDANPGDDALRVLRRADPVEIALAERADRYAAIPDPRQFTALELVGPHGDADNWTIGRDRRRQRSPTFEQELPRRRTAFLPPQSAILFNFRTSQSHGGNLRVLTTETQRHGEVRGITQKRGASCCF